MRTMSKYRNQGGFTLIQVLAGLAVMALLAFLASAMARGQNTNLDPEKAKAVAVSTISMGNNLRNAALRFAQDRDLATMTLDTTTGTGLYDPALTFATKVDVPHTAAASGSADLPFAYDSTSITVTGLGTSAAERAIYVTGLSDVVCKHINHNLFGDAIDAAIPTAVGSRQDGCATISAGGTSSNTYYLVVTPM